MSGAEIAGVTNEWRPAAYAVRSAATLLPLDQVDHLFAHLPQRWIAEQHDKRFHTVRAGLGDWSAARAHVWLERVSWTGEPPVGLFETIERLLAEVADLYPSEDPTEVRRLRRELERMGWTIIAGRSSFVVRSIGDIDIPPTATGIRATMTRMERTLAAGDDPHGLIGHSKDLVEAVSKFTIEACGQVIPERAKLPDLVSAALRAVGYHKDQQASQAAKGLCSAVSNIAIHIVQLRNSTAGSPGHGAVVRDDALPDSQARLVVDSAIAFARFLLSAVDTLDALVVPADMVGNSSPPKLDEL